MSSRTTGLLHGSKPTKTSLTRTKSPPSLCPLHLKVNPVPYLPAVWGLPYAPKTPGPRGRHGPVPAPLFPGGPTLSPQQLSSGKNRLGGGRRPARAGDGERGLPPRRPAHGDRAPCGAGGCPSACAQRRSSSAGRRERGGGPGPAGRGWRGAAPRPEGGCGAAVEGGNGVGGRFASVRELGAGEGGRDRRTDRGSPRRGTGPPGSPAAAARRPMELCPGSAAPSGWALPLLLALGAGLSHATPHLRYTRPGSRSK